MPWADLVQPAAGLARDGFVVDEILADSLNGVLQAVKDEPAELHGELVRVYGHPENRDWRAGDVIRLPDLANTLDRIAMNGPNEF